MRERPILFSGPMVRAVLAGTKTQTRRVVKPCKDSTWGCALAPHELAGEVNHQEDYRNCPFGQPGDRMWVRETFARIDGQTRPWIETDYRATYKHGDRLGDSLGLKKRWTPSIHMPRHASRITLDITGLRIEKLQDISDADALAEGSLTYASEHSTPLRDIPSTEPRLIYRQLWELINGPGSWDANPWVWVIRFSQYQCPPQVI